MEEVQKIKPYITNLRKQLKSLRPDLEKMTSKSLDEQLLLLNNERAKLDLTNKYSYVLSSLMFAYMKVLNVKDTSPIMTELARVKTYMNKAKSFDQRNERETERHQEEQVNAKKVINNALDGNHSGPAISRVNFQGKHTKFENESPSMPREIERDQINAKDIAEKIKIAKSKQTTSSEKRKTKPKPKTHKVSKKK